MPLTVGALLGPFEVLAPLGKGGMGEVFRARDTRLGRDVAIKALPAGFERDPERLARFEREARLLTSLSHPNIAGIHGLEVAEGHRYLVLEYVEGETLAARLARGPLPLDDALEICRQIAAGVEAAHENGVVHRDLKPGNVMLTPAGAVKVLDFGLAKAAAASGSTPGAEMSASPTMTFSATGAGVILGTAAYMSPEQARGKPVDRRTDVWSFGCVLFECLAGRQAYDGETVSDLIARILEREPDWSAIPSNVPPRVVELLHRCLTKDASLRLRDIGEARVALGAPHALAPVAPHVQAGRRAPAWRAPVLAAALAVAATAAAFLVLRPAAPPGAMRRIRIPVSGLTTTFFSCLARTRDGRQIAYEADDRIWTRRWDRFDAVEVPGSKGGRSPFWSWDQKSVGFASGKKLWMFEPGSDQSKVVCDIPESGQILGAAWGPDGRIVFSTWRGGMYEVPANGGDAHPFLPLDSAFVDYHSPGYLPDGRTLLVFVHSRGKDSGAAIVTGSPARLVRVLDDPAGGAVSYAPPGYLLVTRLLNESESAVWATPFSLATHRVTGPGVELLKGAAFASGADDGSIVAAEDPPLPMGQLCWKRRDGGADEPIGDPQPGLAMPALSPDGGRVAYVVSENGNGRIWVRDLVRGTSTKLTSGAAWEESPEWSADGRRIFYASSSNVGNDHILSMASDGSGPADTISHGLHPYPSPDGKSLVCTMDRRGNADLWMVRLDQGNAMQPFLATAANEGAPTISPDGHWVAYMSDESGQEEVYIRRFPEGDQRAQVSVGGGRWPRWTRRGNEIFYVNRDTLASVSVRLGPQPVLGLPRPLFATQAQDLDLRARAGSGFPIDASPDAARFLGIRRIATPATRALLLIENWAAESHRR